MNNIGPVDEAQRFSDSVVGEENTNAAHLQMPDEQLNVADGDWINASKGLVEQHERGAAGDSAGNFTAPSLAAR